MKHVLLTVICWALLALPVQAGDRHPIRPKRAEVIGQRGCWLKIRRGSCTYWAHDSRCAVLRLHRRTKRTLGAVAEGAVDIVEGAGGLVIGLGTETVRRVDGAFRILVFPR